MTKNKMYANCLFLETSNYFIQQEWIKLIKSESKYICYKDFFVLF